MKRSVLYLGLGALLLMSCQKETGIEPAAGTAAASYEVSFTAVSDVSPDSKVSLQEHGTSIWWMPGDAITVFRESGKSAQFTCDISEPSASAVFTGSFSEPLEDGEQVWAVYGNMHSGPTFSGGTLSGLRVPDKQEVPAGGFDRQAVLLVATSTDKTLTFKNVCGGIKFSVSRDDITKVFINTNTIDQIESLTGPVAVTFDESGIPLVTNTSDFPQLTVTPSEGDAFIPGEMYYVMLIPGELKHGFYFSFCSDSKGIGYYRNAKQREIKRSVFGRLIGVDSHVSCWSRDALTLEGVDLGLPSGTIWATTNLGASKQEEFGFYYAWGEVEPKVDFTENNYSLWETESGPIYKYNTDSSKGEVDNLVRLLPEDDAAYAATAGEWRIPTNDEWEELRTGCDWAVTSIGGVSGLEATSKTNGSKLFLPLGGGYVGTLLWNAWADTFYWSMDLALSNTSRAVAFLAREININLGYSWSNICARRAGVQIRAVSGTPYPPAVAVPEAVDLGLPSGVKWASANLGAISEEGTGNFYAWGDTEPHTSFNGWPGYKWCAGSYSALTKYCWYSGYSYDGQTIDFKKYLDVEDDAAKAALGGLWRVPSKDEQDELRNFCNWTWTTKNGVNGYEVTSTVNGNSIFLPATGYCDEGTMYEKGTGGSYWSSFSDDINGVNAISFDASSTCVHERIARCRGLQIRPVYGEYVNVSGVSFPQSEMTLQIGQSYSLNAESIVTPSNASNRSCVWSVSDESVLRIDIPHIYDHFTFTALDEGTATITVTSIDGGYTASCTVTVKGTPIPVKDPLFKQYLLDNYDLNSDGEISEKEAAQITEINVWAISGLKSLQGIEYMPELESIRGAYCGLEEVDTSSNPKLTILSIGANSYTSIDVSHNTKLEVLEVDNTNITSIDVSMLTELWHLHVSNTAMSNLDVSNNTKLEYLGCYGCCLSSIDLSANTSLRSIEIRKNYLETLDVSMCPNLLYLSCSPMNDADGNNLLRTLYVSEGQNIRNVTSDRSSDSIPDETQIVVK